MTDSSPQGFETGTTTPKGRPKTPKSRLLVIDDEAGFRALLTHELGKKGYEVATANNGEEALQKVRQGKFDLAISDVKMPKLGGLEFLEAIKKENPNIEVIMATGFGTIETAVNAMKKGAYDFVQKPFNLPEIFVLVEKALEKRELKAILGVYEASKAIFASIKLDKLLPNYYAACPKDPQSRRRLDSACASGSQPPPRSECRFRK